MSGLKTDNVKVSSGGKGKNITPGNHTCCINKIEVRKPAYETKTPELELRLHLETKPIEGFEGFFIDKDDESKGRYKGQIAIVKSNKWPYKTGTFKGRDGKEFKTDLIQDILVFIKRIEDECGTDFLVRTSGKFDTIEELVAAFNDDAPFKDKWIHFCIGGTAKKNAQGYLDYFLHLPNPTSESKPFAAEGKESIVIEYDKGKHLEIKGEQASIVEKFAGESALSTNEDLGDFATNNTEDLPPWETATEDETFGSIADDIDDSEFNVEDPMSL